MHLMDSFNKFASKWMPLIVIAALCVGVSFSKQINRLTFLVPYIFAFMTFTGTLQSSFRQLVGVVKKPMPLIASIVTLHIIMPLIALGVGTLLFHGKSYFIVGIVLEFVVPSAVASLMWNSIAGGNPSLMLSIVLLDTLAAPFVIPLSLRILVGANVSINVAGMMHDLILMIAVPAVATMAMNQFTGGKAGKKLAPVLAPYGKIALILIITINSTQIAGFILHMTPMLFEIAGTILALAVLGYLLGWLLGYLLHQDTSIVVSMTLGSGMRNISAGAVIAAAYFSAETMFPVIVGTLFQQLLASIFSRLLSMPHGKKKTAATM